jgi:putative acetyltransferase
MIEIRADDLRNAQVIELLQEHVAALRRVSPPGSCHVLDLAGLREADITFWSAWDGERLAGCGALKELAADQGEIKSMRTAAAFLRQGVASRLLRHMIDEAQRRRYRRLSLETGSMSYFDPARALYASFGFAPCGAFGGYVEDPNSVYMAKDLA